jgi:poly-gamma-glutamate biosynthesis protein PgsC/CapC
MHDYLLSSEWVRFAFVLGVAVSMVLYEKRHLTTGSIVVPGYIAVFLVHPLVILATFFNAYVTYAIVNKLLRRYFLLYGRTKFTVLAVVSTVMQTLMLRFTPSGPWLWESDVPLVIGVGYIVPALIAHDMARQGMTKTTKSVLLAGAIVAIPMTIALLLDLPGVNDLAPVDGYGNSAIELTWLPVAVILSVLASWAVAMNYGFRSGGFVGGAFIGMFMADPWQVVVAVIIAAATYLIVAKFLMKHMILFGRRKFSAMLLVSSSIAWSGLWIGDRFLNATWEQHLGVGSLALTPLLLPGLLANDAQRTSPAKVLAGLILAGSFVVSTTWWVQSIVVGQPLEVRWKLVSVASFVVLYQKQVIKLVRYIRRRTDSTDEEVSDTTTEPAPVVAVLDSIAAGVAAMMPTLTPAGADSASMSWPKWAAQHGRVADEAEEWLDAQLRTPSHRSPDLTAPSILEDALNAGRGMRLVPRRPVSEASDAREAQLTASDVSDNTQPSPSDLTEQEMDVLLGLLPGAE